MNSDLKIVSWNANGIRNKINELIDFVNHHNLDIILIQETHLTKNANIKIPNYVAYKNDRVNRGPRAAAGSTAILIKNSITHRRINTPNLSLIEATIIEIPVNNSPQITIISTYIPPGRPPFSTQDLNTLMQIAQNIILMGDLNSILQAWGNRYTNPYGKRLMAFTLSSNIQIIAPDVPTRIPMSSNFKPTTIDMALFKQVPFAHSKIA